MVKKAGKNIIKNKKERTKLKERIVKNRKLLKEFNRIKKVREEITEQVRKDVETQHLKAELMDKRLSDLFDENQINKIKNSPKQLPTRTVRIPLKELTNAINVLKSNDSCGLNDNPKCKRSISELVNFGGASEYAPNSYTALCYEIQNCIATHNWSGLTECLVLLLDGPISLRQVIWKVAMIVLLHNPHVRCSGIMEDFLQMCACCQTESAMEEFLQGVLVLPDELKTIPRRTFKNKECK